MRRPIRFQNVVTGKSVNQSAITSLLSEFPLGERWLALILTISIVLTVGTGTGAISEGELNIIKNLMIKTDRDGVIVNAPGRFLFRAAQFMTKTAPYKDAVAASNGTYRVQLPIIFANPLFLRPDDSALNTKRYNSVELYLTYGGIADLLTTPGTATIAVTMDVGIIKSELAPVAKEFPLVRPYIVSYPPVDPSAQAYLEFEKALDLAICQVIAMSGNTVTAGIPFSGTPSDTTIDTWNIQDNIGFPMMAMKHYNVQYFAKIENQIETWPAGWIWYNFIKDGSIYSAYPTGNKSMARLAWVNGTLSTSGVTFGIFGIRKLA